MILNYIISNFLFKLGYFIFTPKNYSFGGFYGTFINGIKIANFYKKRKIICISFLDYHNKYKQKKIYNLKLTFKILSKFKLDEIILSALFTIILLPFHLIYYLKITSLLNRIIYNKFASEFIPKFFGYGETFTNEELDNKYNFGYKLNLDPKLFLKTNVNIFKNIETKKVAFCIKMKIIIHLKKFLMFFFKY